MMNRRDFFKAAAAVVVSPVVPVVAAAPVVGKFNPMLWGAVRDRDPLWRNMPYKMCAEYSDHMK